MESLGFAIGGLIWGAPVAALVALVVVAVVVGRWRRKAIEALERGELEAEGQRASGRLVGTAEEV
ncbi:hypothetical protein AB0E83_17655 [Streptomyces sp. NPDC035033]|uniref:hypothetical protein n=1 Tax=Streptomyces sp. NPDC035033 TaxID=3155368 RepID=UPI00340B9161